MGVKIILGCGAVVEEWVPIGCLLVMVRDEV